ncbi:MAG: hypothetical protein JXB32_01255 [Deltaproteobacteria bacterium]|nr:hypothetical protein [Deltaproteobacteria bacterium]
MMRSLIALVAACGLLAAAPVSAAEPGQTVINSNYGSLTVAAIFQTLFGARFDGSDFDRSGPAGTPDGTINDFDDVFLNNHYDFQLQRARIILKGNLLSPNLTYAFQGDATLPEFVLDAKMSYIIPEAEGISTAITVGRTLPPFTLILPRLVSRLDAINYPLYLFLAQGGARQPFSPLNNTGRMVGLFVTQKLTPMFQLDIGVFNGFQRNPDLTRLTFSNFADENDPKDFFVRAQVKPIEGLLFAADFWAGFPASVDSDGDFFALSATDPTLENNTNYFAVFEAEFTMIEGLKIMGEFAYTHQTTRTMDAATGARSEATTDGIGGWFHAGYLFKDLLGAGADFEFIARLDYWDADMDNDDNDSLRVTVGPHFFLEGLHSQIRLNYLFNAAQTPLTPTDDGFDDQRHELWLQAVVEI